MVCAALREPHVLAKPLATRDSPEVLAMALENSEGVPNLRAGKEDARGRARIHNQVRCSNAQLRREQGAEFETPELKQTLPQSRPWAGAEA